MAGRQKHNDIYRRVQLLAMDAEPHNTTHQEGRKVLFVGDHDPSWLGGRGNAVLHEADRGKLLSGTSALAAMPGEGGYDDEDDEDDYDYDEDEDYVLSGSSGRARMVLGNRRLGQNGYMRSGRLFARPVPPTIPSTARGKVQGCSKPHNTTNTTNSKNSSSSSSNTNTTNSNNQKNSNNSTSNNGNDNNDNDNDNDISNNSSSGITTSAVVNGPRSSSVPGPSTAASGSSSCKQGPGAEGKQGRRAKRNQKRAAADLDDPNECY